LRYLPPDLIASDNKVFINILLGEFYGRKHKIQPHAIENTFIKKAQSYDGEGLLFITASEEGTLFFRVFA
jgi:hypothetical protein